MVDDVVQTLVRWTDSGAIWRVVHRSPTSVTVSLCTCDGGEEMQRIDSRDPAVIAFIGDRTSSEG